MQVLRVERISRDAEDSSALERQDLELTAAIVGGGHTEAGRVRDATVSGSVNLDERPSLGKWLREPLVHTWEALMVTTQDRISRDDMHWWQFVGWCLKNKKTIIVLDDPSFDITTEDGRMIAGIKATQAAKYRKAVQDKRRNQTAYYREEELWPGGTWPFGYRQQRVTHNGKPRWKLVVDEYTSSLDREAFAGLVNQNRSVGSIRNEWNERGILTAIDYQRHVNALEGREGVSTEVRGTKWSTSALVSVLTNPALMGYAVHKGEIRKKNGLPVQWAEPIFTRDEFDKLQEVIKRRGAHRAGIRSTDYDLLRVLYCPCGEPLYSNSATRGTRKYFYVICKTRQDKTPCQYVKSWDRTFLQEALSEMFLTELGGVEITAKRFVPGHDRGSEIQELRESLDNLAQAIAQAKNATVIEALGRTMEEHANNLEALEAEPIIPSRWDEMGTGQTYRAYWESSDWARRGELLRNSGVRLYVGGKPTAPDLHLYVPEDLAKRAHDAMSGAVDSNFLGKWDAQVREWRALEGPQIDSEGHSD